MSEEEISELGNQLFLANQRFAHTKTQEDKKVFYEYYEKLKNLLTDEERLDALESIRCSVEEGCPGWWYPSKASLSELKSFMYVCKKYLKMEKS